MKSGIAWKTALLLTFCMLAAGCGRDIPSAEDSRPVQEAPPDAAPLTRPPADNDTKAVEPPPSETKQPVSPPVSPPASADEWVELKHVHSGFEFNAADGSLLGADSKDDTLTLYPRAYLEGTSADVDEPVSVSDCARVVWKRFGDKSYFVATLKSGPLLHVLDGRTLETVAQVTLPAPNVTDTGVSRNPDDPYVYLCFRDSAPFAALNLETMQVEAPQCGSARLLWVSWDGTRCYGVRNEDLGIFSRERNADGETVWKLTGTAKPSGGGGVCLPHDAGMIIGADMWEADLSRKIGGLPGHPLCVFESRPLAICGDPHATPLMVSLNSLQALQPLRLPKGFRVYDTPDQQRPGPRLPVVRRTPGGPYPLQLFADEARGRVVVASGRRVDLLSLADLDLPDEPWLFASIEMPKSVLVGEKTVVPIVRKNEATQVGLRGAPEGMTIEDDRIVWTPDASQVGPVTFALRLFHGRFEKSISANTHVSQPFIRLEFSPDGIAVSPDGRRAVLFTNARTRGGKADASSWMAVVDVARRELVAQKEILYSVFDAVLDDERIYVTPTHANRINTLSLKDLSAESFVNVDFRPESLKLLSAEVLAVTAGPGDAKCLYFSLKDVTRVNAVDALRTRQQELRNWQWPYVDSVLPLDPKPAPRNARPERFLDGFSAEGCLWRVTMDKPRMLIDVNDMAVLPPDRPRELVPPWSWDRHFAQNALRNGRGQELRKAPEGPSAIMEALPIAVTLQTGFADARPSASLLLQDLVGGRENVRIPLIRDEPAGRGFPYSQLFTAHKGLLAFGGRSILAHLGDRLFIQPVDDETTKRFPAPFQLKPLDELVFLDPTRSNEIVHATAGGTPPLEFELNVARKGMGIDPKTGVLTLDGPGLMEDAAEFLAGKFKDALTVRQDGRGARNVVAGPAERLALLAEVTKGPFLRVAGREPKGIPVLLPVGIVAGDSQGQMTKLDYQVLIEVPLERVLGRIEQLRKKPDDEKPPPPAA